MTTDTLTLSAAIPIASQDDEQAWLDARAEGATASEAARFMNRSAWPELLADKLNGSRFHGNKHTRRGHEREALILADVALVRGTSIIANSHLWVSREDARAMATPDAFETAPDGTVRGVEVKSHKYGYTPPASGIPAGHLDQCLIGLDVTGIDEWVYAYAIDGEDEQPTLDDPTIHIIRRIDHEARIAELRAGRAAFLQWWDDGAPALSVSDELLAAQRRLLHAKVLAATAAAELKARSAEFEALLQQESPSALSTGWKNVSDAGTVQLRTPAKSTRLDETAFAKAEPAKFDDWKRMQDAVDETRQAATLLYAKTTYAKPALVVTPAKAATA